MVAENSVKQQDHGEVGRFFAARRYIHGDGAASAKGGAHEREEVHAFPCISRVARFDPIKRHFALSKKYHTFCVDTCVHVFERLPQIVDRVGARHQFIELERAFLIETEEARKVAVRDALPV